MTPVIVLWDLNTDAAAHDPQGCYGDGLCPLAVYTSPDLARHALECATAQRKRVELRTMVLAEPPARAELPTIELDELEPAGGHSLRRESAGWISPEVALVCTGSLPRHAPLRGGLDTFERDE